MFAQRLFEMDTCVWVYSHFSGGGILFTTRGNGVNVSRPIFTWQFGAVCSIVVGDHKCQFGPTQSCDHS